MEDTFRYVGMSLQILLVARERVHLKQNSILNAKCFFTEMDYKEKNCILNTKRNVQSWTIRKKLVY